MVLFERTGRSLVPTPNAPRLADSARAMEAGADQLARSVSGAEVGVSGSVRITASQPVACADDLMAQWEAVRAGFGIGFFADFVARGDKHVLPVLPMLRIPPPPVWLTVPREIRSSRRIRAVYDFLAEAVPRSLAPVQAAAPRPAKAAQLRPLAETARFIGNG